MLLRELALASNGAQIDAASADEAEAAEEPLAVVMEADSQPVGGYSRTHQHMLLKGQWATCRRGCPLLALLCAALQAEQKVFPAPSTFRIQWHAGAGLRGPHLHLLVVALQHC
jgi:hypothetical protein